MLISATMKDRKTPIMMIAAEITSREVFETPKVIALL